VRGGNLTLGCNPIDILPDAMTGAILAMEGIRDSLTILNGPTGCKYFHASISDSQYPRSDSIDPLGRSGPFFFGQPRVPTTYLESDDYIFGSSAKVEQILAKLGGFNGLTSIVNSPAASLLAEDLNRLIKNDRTIFIESTGFSDTIYDGFQRAIIQLLERFSDRDVECGDTKSVNLIGISIYHKHWQGNIEEICSLLSLMGIRVNSVISAGTAFRDMVDVRRAAANIVVHEEYGIDIARWLESELSMPYINPSSGSPLGFDSIESFILEVADSLGVDPSPALESVRKARKHCFRVISRYNSLSGLPKGATFAIHAEPSLALPLVHLLHDYLGMIPIRVSLTTERDLLTRRNLEGHLRERGFKDSLTALEEAYPDVLFSDGNTISKHKLINPLVEGIEVSLPSHGFADVLPKAILGIRGTYILLEKVLNGIYRVY